jgi:hypothetical protein
MMLPLYSLSWSPVRHASPASSTQSHLSPAISFAARARSHFARLWLCSLLSLLVAAPVIAQPSAAGAHPSAVVLSTAGGHASARALDSVLSAALDDLKVVNVVARPGMDLGAVQLALDCVAETPQCLRLVTSQHEAEMLVAPTLARISNELVLTLLRFDARSGKTQRVLKRQAGQTLSSDTLDAVPDLLRELFGLPAKVETPPPAPTPAEPAKPAAGEGPINEPLPEPPMEAPSAERKVPVGPLLLGGGGVLLIGAGLVMGITVLNLESQYRDVTMTDLQSLSRRDAEAVVDQANDYKSSGETNAVISNVFLGLGGAVLIASGIWFAVELSKRPPRYEDQQVRVAPMLGRHELGLVLTHRGAGL